MNMKNIFCSLLVASFLGACSGNGYEQMTDGIIVKIRHPYPQSARLLRFQVMGEKLIHVSATPEDEFTDKKSLIIVPDNCSTRKTDSVSSQTKWRYDICNYEKTYGLSVEFYGRSLVCR